MHIRCVAVLLGFFAVAEVSAQSCPTLPPGEWPQTCLTIPASSPILAPNVDDIPPGCGQVITHTGSYAPARANGRFAFAQINDNEQKVWFGSDSAPPDGRVYYNRRYRANASSPWYWQYSTSVTVMNLGDTSTGPNTVLYSPTPRYRNYTDVTGDRYHYMMYSVSQPRNCDGKLLGIVFVAFSNDGVCWSQNVRAFRSGGAGPFECYNDTDLVTAETLSAIDVGNTIYLFTIEGDVPTLVDHTQMNRTQTYAYTTSPDYPHAVTMLTAWSELSNAGVVSPTGDPGGAKAERYRPYNYFLNMDTAFDAATGYLYIARAYPYPFDREALIWGATVPCSWQGDQVEIYDPSKGQMAPVQGCLMSPATLPNRIQIYRMYLGTMTQINNVMTGTWTLVGDYGGAYGYTNAYFGCSAYTARSAPWQQNVGRDFGYANFVRDAKGLLVPNGVYGSILAGDSFKLSKGVGHCLITGTERVIKVDFTR